MGNQSKILVEKFVKKEKILWPREMKLAKQLVAKHGLEVFLHLVLGYDLNSLAFFKTQRGQHIIRKEKALLQKLERKQVEKPKEDSASYERKTEAKKGARGILGI